MTVKLGESSGEEGVKKLGKRAGGDEESLEEEGAGGGGEAAPGSSSTKKEEKIINSNTNSSPSPNPSLAQAPAALQPSHSQDQHHFLRSSVRPQSKRLKKDSQASSSVGSSTAVKGKGTVFWNPQNMQASGVWVTVFGGCHSPPADAIFCLVLGKVFWGLFCTVAEIFFVSQGFSFSAAHSPVCTCKNGGIWLCMWKRGGKKKALHY